MRWRFTISRRIALGFGMYILAFVLVFYLTDRTLSGSRSTLNDISSIYAPSKQELISLHRTMERCQALAQNWTDVQSRSDDKSKTELRKYVNTGIPQLLASIDSLSAFWPDALSEELELLNQNTNFMCSGYKEIMTLLPDFNSYEPQNRFGARLILLEGEPHHQAFLDFNLYSKHLIDHFSLKEDEGRTAMTESFLDLSSLMVWMILFLFGTGVLIAILVIRSITMPINQLKKTLLYLGKGIYPQFPMRVSNDEIGDMAFAVNRLVDGLRKTKEFSSSVGQGRFDAPYQPLSDEDELGYALLKMRDELAKNERILEMKVLERTNEVVAQKEEIEKQKEKVTGLYKDLKDSINYARRIQQSILPTTEQVLHAFPDSFIFYRPKDIVSGDFYWIKKAGNRKLIAAIDCTGHGVPGAFMSLVGYNMLNQITKVFTMPAQILNNLNRVSQEMLREMDGGHDLRDGMDLAMCSLNTETLQLEFAGAHHPLYIVRNRELIIHRGDKFAIGSFVHGEKEYTNHIIQLQEGDMVYLFSDGYADQFGGPKGKKYLMKRFRQTLLEISDMPLFEQRAELHKRWVQWKGNEDQVDDILVIGISI